MDSLQFRAMNTQIFLAAEGDSRWVKPALAAARSLIEEQERRFTRFSPESELSQLNRSAGGWFRASPEMIGLLLSALERSRETGGLFNPAILPDLLRAGYDVSMDILRLRGASAPLYPLFAPRALAPLEEIQILPEESLIGLPAGLSLDLGGIAKGWIAARAADLLADSSSACLVNAGGDMVMRGLLAGQSAWEIGLEDPRAPDQVLAALRVPPGAVATSSVTRRVWQQGETSRHHLIDPRSGEPAESDWLCVTAYSSHADTVEAFAKALLIAGPAEAQQIISGVSGLAFLAVDRQGKIWGAPESLRFFGNPCGPLLA